MFVNQGYVTSLVRMVSINIIIHVKKIRLIIVARMGLFVQLRMFMAHQVSNAKAVYAWQRGVIMD